jgi:hypothetical protein
MATIGGIVGAVIGLMSVYVLFLFEVACTGNECESPCATGQEQEQISGSLIRWRCQNGKIKGNIWDCYQ